MPNRRFSDAGELRESGLSQAGFFAMALDQLGKGDHFPAKTIILIGNAHEHSLQSESPAFFISRAINSTDVVRRSTEFGRLSSIFIVYTII
jgi:hypothetical protein